MNLNYCLEGKNFDFDQQRRVARFSEGSRCSRFMLQTSIINLSCFFSQGYELHIPRADCLRVVHALFEAKDDLVLAGSEALMAMSMEAGFKHWHGDIETTDTPQEAGLLFTCDLKSPNKEYIGKKQVLASKQTKRSMKRRLVTFTTEGCSNQLNGLEVIYRYTNALFSCFLQMKRIII